MVLYFLSTARGGRVRSPGNRGMLGKAPHLLPQACPRPVIYIMPPLLRQTHIYSPQHLQTENYMILLCHAARGRKQEAAIMDL